MLSFVDLVPTLLDLAEIADPEFVCDGISQQAVLTGNVASIRDGVTVMHPVRSRESKLPDQHALITADGWKLVYYAGEKGGQLYNLKNDPKELNNLYNLPEYAQVQQHLCLELLDRLIKDNDKEALLQASHADEFGCHVMVDRLWHEEFETMERLNSK